jgi:hypothetical protein
MSYSQALEAKFAIIRGLQSEAGIACMASMYRDALREQTIPADATPEEFMETNTMGLGDGEPYYWSPEITEMIATVSKTMPEWTLREEALPSSAGFFHFAKPIVLPAYREYRGPCIAMTWRVLNERHGGRFVSVAFYFEEYRGDPIPMPEFSAPLSFGCGWQSGLADLTQSNAHVRDRGIPDRMKAAIAVFAACVAFLEQSILVAPMERATRATARRLAREGYVQEPLIRVVKLRRASNQAVHHEAGGETIEWTCSWLVRGYWATRWCGPGGTEKRAVYVMPHVKGPADKPLKAPAERVFAVVR